MATKVRATLVLEYDPETVRPDLLTHLLTHADEILREDKIREGVNTYDLCAYELEEE